MSKRNRNKKKVSEVVSDEQLTREAEEVLGVAEETAKEDAEPVPGAADKEQEAEKAEKPETAETEEPEGTEDAKAEAKAKANKRKKRNTIYNVLIVLFAAMMVVSGYFFVERIIQYKKGNDEYNSVRSSVITYNNTDSSGVEKVEGQSGQTGATDNEKTVSADEIQAATEEIPPITVDFKALKEINEDCVGWLYMEATGLSYPIMHGDTNDAYLYTTIEGNYNVNGSIFVEASNVGDFTEPNTIVYGHNMASGAMFAENEKYFYNDAYKTSPYFWVLTPEGNYKYQIFTAFEDAADGEAYTIFNGPGAKFLEWCLKMKGRDIIECDEQDFSVYDHIVTLSTCSGKPDIRLVIMGVCISGNIPNAEKLPEQTD